MSYSVSRAAHNLPTYDAFYDAGIRHILVRHEAGGGPPLPEGLCQGDREGGASVWAPAAPAPPTW